MSEANPVSADQRAYRVTFSAVGRGKRSWVSTLKHPPSEAILEDLVRKSGALMSDGIECVFDEDMEYGTILVGGFRPAGAFRVEAL